MQLMLDTELKISVASAESPSQPRHIRWVLTVNTKFWFKALVTLSISSKNARMIFL